MDTKLVNTSKSDYVWAHHATAAKTAGLSDAEIHRVAEGPDAERLAGISHTVRLWDVSTLQEVCELRGHEDYVHAVAFSPDGSRLASASGDLTVRIWDTVPPSVRALPLADPSSLRGGDSGRGRSPIPSDGTPARPVAPP